MLGTTVLIGGQVLFGPANTYTWIDIIINVSNCYSVLSLH